MRGVVRQTAVVFLCDASTRRNPEALEVFRRHNVRVVLLPPHLTHVLQPADIGWASKSKQFRAANSSALHRYGSKPAIERGAFQSLGESLERSPGKHRELVPVVLSICEGFAAVTSLSSSSRGSGTRDCHPRTWPSRWGALRHGGRDAWDTAIVAVQAGHGGSTWGRSARLGDSPGSSRSRHPAEVHVSAFTGAQGGAAGGRRARGRG